MYTLFDQERINELNRLDAEKNINKLYDLLKSLGRANDVLKAVSDEIFRNKLKQEFAGQY